MNTHNINTIARYEAKLLKRGWLFRVFAVLILLVMTVNLLNSSTNVFWEMNAYWKNVALTSSIPFMATRLYALAQAIIVIFLAGNIIKRDKKLDTAEVLYVRPMSNADYIIGKVWGIMRVFIGMNVIVLAEGLLINVLLSRSPVNVWYYLIYIFTISLPSLLFILGLSFSVMTLVKNQAVTFIIMLGVAATATFYLSDKLYGVLDFFGGEIPSLFSDVTGHSNLEVYLWQRGIYYLLATGFILLTIAAVNRLPLKPWKTKILACGSVIFICLGLLAAYGYVHHFENKIKKREMLKAVYEKVADIPKASIFSNKLLVKQEKDVLFVESKLKLVNRHHDKLDKLVLFLNPSLTLNGVKCEGKEVSFEREAQSIIIDKSIVLKDSVELTLTYSGKIDEDICYLDIENDAYFKKPEGEVIFYGKRYVYQTDKYMLLTPECIWYPMAENPVNPAVPYDINKDFTYYTLNYILRDTNKQQVVISQGEEIHRGDTVQYINHIPLTGISLTVGNYEKLSIIVDSLSYELYLFRGHDYFTKHFNLIKDTLPAIIRTMQEVVDNKRIYPFARFAMVETPIHFTSYTRNWKGYTELIMPEIAFLSEKGVVGISSDFKSESMRKKQWGSRNATMEDDEVQVQVFKDFVTWTFINETRGTSDWQADAQLNKLDIGGMLFAHSGFLYSQDFPLANIVVNMMQSANPTQTEVWRRMWTNTSALTDDIKANIYLSKHSFREAMVDKDLKPKVFYELLKLKTFELKNYLLSYISAQELTEFLKEFSEQYLFSEYPFAEFTNAFKQKHNIDLTPFLKEWYIKNKTPLILVKDVDAKMVLKDEFTKYKIRFLIYNPSPVNAIVTVKADASGNNRGGRPGGGMGGNSGAATTDPHYYQIPAQTAMEIKIIQDDRPSSLTINTNIAQNLPNTLPYTFTRIDAETTDTTTGAVVVDTLLFRQDADELIIDDEDKGFHIIKANNKHALKDFFKKEDEDKYKVMNYWRPHSVWTPFFNNRGYGTPVSSMVYKKKGVGKNRVEWRANIAQSGYYELSIWNPRLENQGGRRGGGWGRGGGGNPQTQTYTITYGESKDVISLDLQQGDKGWVALGDFYLPEGETVISLGDNVSWDFAVADAVKITRLGKRK
ncbi:xanthan lyase [Bacteroidia bacterium]|nr:xanthan lyase [Bacteroidia bacterium]